MNNPKFINLETGKIKKTPIHAKEWRCITNNLGKKKVGQNCPYDGITDGCYMCIYSKIYDNFNGEKFPCKDCEFELYEYYI